MKKLSDDEKAKLQAKIEQARTERIQLITESLSEWKGCWDGGGKQMQIQRIQAKSVIEWVLRGVGALLIFVLGCILLGVVQEYRLYLFLGGVFFILFAYVTIVNALKSLKDRDYEWTRWDTEFLIGHILICVVIGVFALFMILEWFSDLDDDWEGIVVDKWIHKTNKPKTYYYVAVEYGGKRYRRWVMPYIWESARIGDTLIKREGSFRLKAVHAHLR